MSKKIYKEKYFPHDRHARQDPKIKKMLVHFRKNSELQAQAAVCIYWWIVEDMHTDDYPVNNLDAFADDYRCDVEFLKSILNDFELFHIVDDCYVSDRVLRNLKEQQEKSEKARKSSQARWNKRPQTQGEPEQPPEPDTPQDNPEIDDELVNSIIQIYNTEFKKSQIVGKATREKIFKITKENNLSLEIWQKVFKNAKRGWNIKGENKKPNLKNILDNWDAFASDDYFLAPDEETIKSQQKAKEVEKQKIKEADIHINREYFDLDNKLMLYDDYRILNGIERLKAIEFYNTHYNSIEDTIAYIKKGLN